MVVVGFSVYFANAVGFCVGAFVNVILIRQFVFTDSRFQLGHDVLFTVVINGIILSLGMGVLWVLVEALNVNPYWAKLVTNSVTFIFNYLIRLFYFRKR